MNKQEIIFKFLDGNESINANSIEKELDLSRNTILRGKRYIPKSKVNLIYEYLDNEYGIGEWVSVVGNSDNPDISGRTIWMDGWLFGADDTVERFRDPVNGLWKVLRDWSGYMRLKDGSLALKESWESVDGELHHDEVGDYWVANNGISVYFKYTMDCPKKR